MNIHSKFGSGRQPAEPERRRFTVDDVRAMVRAGIIAEGENVELIDGEIITMAAKSPRHDDMKAAVADFFSDSRGRAFRVAQEFALRLADHWEPEPDIALIPFDMRPSQVRGPDALLVVEVAVSSLSIDLDVKAPGYAAHGVREYWVIDAKRLVTHVHREPGPDGYASVIEVAADVEIEPMLIRGLRLRLSEFGFDVLEGDEA